MNSACSVLMRPVQLLVAVLISVSFLLIIHWRITWLLPASSQHVSTHELPRVGFDLTPSYGTAAISYTNGSNIALGRINGSDEYRDAFFRLSLSPYILDSSHDDITILADMVVALRRLTEDRLQTSIPAATATVPRFAKLTDRLMRAIFATANLRYVQIRYFDVLGQPLTWHENSILAGQGVALCQPYTADAHCNDDRHLSTEAYYLVGYYADGIEVLTTAEVTLAYSVRPYAYHDLELGSRMRYRNPDESYYWEEVRKLLWLPLAGFAHRKPTKVILYGESSEDEKFRSVVNETLQAFLTHEMPDMIDNSINPTFNGALGAAELVKREPYWDDRIAAMHSGEDM